MGQQSNNQLLQALIRVEKALLRTIESQKEPIVVLRSNLNNLSSNHADGFVILESPPTPANTKIVVEDWNINFTTVAGTVRAVILDANNNEINNILRDVSSSTNGTGATVMETGHRLAVIGQSAGAGVFGCYFSGFKQKVSGFNN